MANAHTGTTIEFHILQSFPVTCLNRDDVGAPKSALVGGVPRARVSSQSWKRAVRMALHDLGVNIGTRTKHAGGVFSAALEKEGATAEQAVACGTHMANVLVDDTLLFISDADARAFASLAREKGFAPEKITEKDLSKAAKNTLVGSLDGLDVALFGRMVAKAQGMEVEAAASFSHAISTHKVTNEVEFFTALDDLQEEAGSAHMGTLEFNSATYYRYISLDLGQLADTIGEASVPDAVDALTKALYVAVPGGRQTTQSGASPWEFARVFVRKGQRLQVPFEEPVKKGQGGGFLAPSVEALKAYLDQKEKLSGSLFGKIARYDWGEDAEFSIDDLSSALKSHL